MPAAASQGQARAMFEVRGLRFDSAGMRGRRAAQDQSPHALALLRLGARIEGFAEVLHVARIDAEMDLFHVLLFVKTAFVSNDVADAHQPLQAVDQLGNREIGAALDELLAERLGAPKAQGFDNRDFSAIEVDVSAAHGFWGGEVIRTVSDGKALPDILLDPCPEAFKRRVYFGFDRPEFDYCKGLPGLRCPAGKHVKLDLRLRAGRADGNAAPIGEVDHQHLFLRDAVALRVGEILGREVARAAHSAAIGLTRRLSKWQLLECVALFSNSLRWPTMRCKAGCLGGCNATNSWGHLQFAIVNCK